MSVTTHAPKQIDPSASLHAEALGQAKSHGRDASRRRSDRALTVPFGRQGTGWEVAYAALFPISNKSSYVNAHTLLLDAGHMAGVVRS